MYMLNHDISAVNIVDGKISIKSFPHMQAALRYDFVVPSIKKIESISPWNLDLAM